MPPEMDYYWPQLSPPPLLSECDVGLVKKALTIILHLNTENSTTPHPPESIQIAYALNKYIIECNRAFLASERIRLFLLLSLFASLIISFIVLTTLPISAVSVTLICIISSLLFSVNIFTLLNQMSGYQQEIDWSKLKQHCLHATEKLYSGNFKPTSHLNNPLDQISSPTSDPCMFSAKKIPKNAALNPHTDDVCLNHSEYRLSPIDEASKETNNDTQLLYRSLI
ncbi:MAG: hypothetical protein WAL30_03385 [Candidatus Aquirickettsiella sp.]